MIDTDEPIVDITFVAFDVETTGLTPVIDRIVEIGAVKFRDGEVIDTFHDLVDCTGIESGRQLGCAIRL